MDLDKNYTTFTESASSEPITLEHLKRAIKLLENNQKPETIRIRLIVNKKFCKEFLKNYTQVVPGINYSHGITGINCPYNIPVIIKKWQRKPKFIYYEEDFYKKIIEDKNENI